MTRAYRTYRGSGYGYECRTELTSSGYGHECPTELGEVSLQGNTWGEYPGYSSVHPTEHNLERFYVSRLSRMCVADMLCLQSTSQTYRQSAHSSWERECASAARERYFRVPFRRDVGRAVAAVCKTASAYAPQDGE